MTIGIDAVDGTPPPGRWTTRFRDDLAGARRLLDRSDASSGPDVVVALAAVRVPGCEWASLLFTPSAPRGLRDATSSPVMVGVLAADATTRSGPLRSLLRRGLSTAGARPLSIPDVGRSPRWARFAAALARTSPGVHNLVYLPIAASGAVLVLAAGTAGSLDDLTVAGALVITSCVHGFLDDAARHTVMPRPTG